MKKETTPLRLIYPQWQGGIVDHWMPDIPAEDSSRGYYLGAQLLNLLAPDSNQKNVEVPVSLDINDRATEKGINSRNVIVKQSKAALDILNENKPDRIIGRRYDDAEPKGFPAGTLPHHGEALWTDKYRGAPCMVCIPSAAEEIVPGFQHLTASNPQPRIQVLVSCRETHSFKA